MIHGMMRTWMKAGHGAIRCLLRALLCCLPFAGCDTAVPQEDLFFSECEEIALSDLFGCRALRRVALQDPDSVLLTAPSIFRATGRYLVACEPFAPRPGVWLFAPDGSYLGRVGRVGRGPGEYVVPMDALTDPAGDTLYVVDKGRRELAAYSLPDREFRAGYPLRFNAKCVAMDRSGHLVWYVSASNTNAGSYETLVTTDARSRVIAQAPAGVEQLDRYSGMWQTLTLFSDAPEGLTAHHQFQPELFPATGSATGSADGVRTLRFEHHGFAPASFDWRDEGFRERIAASPYVQYYDVFETSE